MTTKTEICGICLCPKVKIPGGCIWFTNQQPCRPAKMPPHCSGCGSLDFVRIQGSYTACCDKSLCHCADPTNEAAHNTENN